MANTHYANEFLDKALRAEISSTIVNTKANVCPFTVRLAWHASGTIDINDTNPATAGGSNGATMRFTEECSDGANAGLDLMQKILAPIKKKYPTVSYADLWTLAGTQAIKLTGGPDVPFRYGRTDDPDSTTCPPNGRLPDAALGAQHLRDVFYRMGFTDKDIVALSGAHTLGSCHKLRSGFDGPWTSNPLKFDNEYYKNLLEKKWVQRKWDGPIQYEDEETKKLMMLPTDIALIEDAEFLKYVKLYAENEKVFFDDFAIAFGQLISLGCPAQCKMDAPAIEKSTDTTPEKEFRDLAMHGSTDRMKEVVAANPTLDINSIETGSGRTAAHKASYFGHAHVIEYLSTFGTVNYNIQDNHGDTPLHDAARFGHSAVVTALLTGGASNTITNILGKTPSQVASDNDMTDVATMLA
jgi:catalase (peroxidase I)